MNSMDTKDQSDLAYTILSALIKLAPDGKAQAALSRAYSEVDGYSEQGVDHKLELVTSILYDGITYGNWPWMDYTVDSVVSS